MDARLATADNSSVGGSNFLLLLFLLLRLLPTHIGTLQIRFDCKKKKKVTMDEPGETD